MILTWHFTFFLLNVLVWIIAGLAISKFMVQKKTKLRKMRKFLIVGIFGAVFGGLFGFLANGMPDIGISVNNLLSALAFSAFPLMAMAPRKSKVKNRQKVYRSFAKATP